MTISDVWRAYREAQREIEELRREIERLRTVAEWQPISTAPKDGTWYLICRACEGLESCEVGCFNPLLHDQFIEVEGGLYKKERRSAYDYRGFNNHHRSTHWHLLPEPPKC